MNEFESPIDFLARKKVGETEIVYSRLLEVVQGGPILGDISINDKNIPKYRFGGPALIDKDAVYVPLFIRKFFTSGFKIAKISIPDLAIKTIGPLRPVICLSRIDGDKLYFFEDIGRTILTHIAISS